MIRASRPRGVHEAVMEVLLNVVHDLLLEIGRAVAEQTNTRRGLFHDRFVARSDSVRNVLCQQRHDAGLVRVRDAARLFLRPSTLVAGSTVRNTLPDGQMASAEQVPTENAEADRFQCHKKLTAR